MADLLLHNAELIPMDGVGANPLGALRTASLRIRGDRITEIGELTPVRTESVIEAAGLVAMPGFVQTHVHFCQTLLRGLADDLPLMDWLQQRIWPLEAAHDATSLRASARLSLLELLQGGTTTAQVMESVRHTEVSFQAAAETGLTTVMGNCLMDQVGSGIPPGLETSAARAMQLCEELRSEFDGVGRLHYAVSPRFILSCSDELSRDAADFAAQHGLRIHTHACEHPDEVEAVRRSRDADTIVAMRDQGLLGERTGLAHCVHTTDEERRILVETGTAVLHCPSTNLKLGSGVAPIAAYRELGLRVGIGADGAPCNNRLSALTEVRQAALLQAAHAGPGRWPAAQVLRAATRGGAEALGLDDDLGTLECGKRADVVLFDLDDLEPGGPVASKLVYSATEQHIRHVVLGGEVVVEDGQPTRVDPDEIRARAVEARDALLARAGG